eukprot:TRINITY_DN6975_c0_g1_i1.p1 TRINITY_DN6975_c0_g1~~TRINITY_DN6975_c0_g1_i1.p1  ORF type:complete len:458 (-),score=115.14 TRINITY_DN6975_c0_g1_i1:260-1633(-)
MKSSTPVKKEQPFLDMEQKLARWHERLQQVEMKLGKRDSNNSQTNDPLSLSRENGLSGLIRPRLPISDPNTFSSLNTNNLSQTPYNDSTFNYRSVISSIDSKLSTPLSSYLQTPTKHETQEDSKDNIRLNYSHNTQPSTPSSTSQQRPPYFGWVPQNYSGYYPYQNVNLSFSPSNNNTNNFQDNTTNNNHNHNLPPRRHPSSPVNLGSTYPPQLQSPNSPSSQTSPRYCTAQQLGIDIGNYTNSVDRSVRSVPQFSTPLTTPPTSPQIYNYTKHVSGDYHEGYYPQNKPDQMHPRDITAINAAKYIQTPQNFETKPETKLPLQTPDQVMHNMLVTSEELEDIMKKRKAQPSQISPRSTQSQASNNLSHAHKPESNGHIEIHAKNHFPLRTRSRSPSPPPSNRKKEKPTPTTPKNTPNSTQQNTNHTAPQTTTPKPTTPTTLNRVNSHENNNKVNASK